MNWAAQMVLAEAAGLTTSTALTIVGLPAFSAVKAHFYPPVLAGIVTAALLAWKQANSAVCQRSVRQMNYARAILLAISPSSSFRSARSPGRSWGLIERSLTGLASSIIAAIVLLITF